MTILPTDNQFWRPFAQARAPRRIKPHHGRPADHHRPVATLRAFVADIFAKAGTSQEEGERIAHHLIGANLAGHDSHGVIRVPRYVLWLQNGSVVAGQTPEVVTESPAHAVLDGGFGFGQTIGPLAVDMGIAKAQRVRHGGDRAAQLRAYRPHRRLGGAGGGAGLVSIHFVNVAMGELVAPFGGVDRRFSTNPFCVGAPQPGADPLILDFATSTVAEGKVLVASNGGKPLPAGALIDPDGTLSTNPESLYGPITPATRRGIRRRGKGRCGRSGTIRAPASRSCAKSWPGA